MQAGRAVPVADEGISGSVNRCVGSYGEPRRLAARFRLHS